MSAFAELWRAVLGWLDLLTAQPDAADKFNLSRAGLINAVGFYMATVLLGIAVVALAEGYVPGWMQLAIGLMFNLIVLFAILIAAAATARLMRADPLALAIPSAYAMGIVAVLSLPLVHVQSEAGVLALLGVRGFMFFRAARGVGKLGRGVSAAFAILCIVLLAAIPLGLYMLTTGGQGIG